MNAGNANIISLKSESKGMEKLKLIIPGKPIAKARPKFVVRKTWSKKRGRMVNIPVGYNKQETEEGRFLHEVKRQIGHGFDMPPIFETDAINLKCLFKMPIPKSATKKDRNLIDMGVIRHTKKPDLTNLIKFIEDCLNQVIWYDDSQIVHLDLWKLYDEQPATVIEIEPF